MNFYDYILHDDPMGKKVLQILTSEMEENRTAPDIVDETITVLKQLGLIDSKVIYQSWCKVVFLLERKDLLNLIERLTGNNFSFFAVDWEGELNYIVDQLNVFRENPPIQIAPEEVLLRIADDLHRSTEYKIEKAKIFMDSLIASTGIVIDRNEGLRYFFMLLCALNMFSCMRRRKKL